MVLQQALADQNDEVRAVALERLALMGVEGALDLLVQATQDSAPSVRLVAIDMMDPSEQNRPYLLQALSDSDAAVRELAGIRLGLR